MEPVTQILKMQANNGSVQKAIQYSDTLTDAERERFLLQVFRDQGRKDAFAAFDLLDSIEDPMIDKSRLSDAVFEEWSAYDPKAAGEWVASMGEALDSTPTTAAAVARAWLRYDSYEASQWILTLPEGLARDLGSRELVRGMVDFNLNAALLWAGAIDDVQIRREELGYVIDVWKSINRDEALSALNQLSISKEDKGLLVQRLAAE